MNWMVTAVAAAYVASPAWVALILQVPTFLSVTVSPLTVQMVVDDEVKVTGRFEDADGLRTTVGLCIDCGPGFGNVIVCGALVTLKERATAVAAA